MTATFVLLTDLISVNLKEWNMESINSNLKDSMHVYYLYFD